MDVGAPDICARSGWLRRACAGNMGNFLWHFCPLPVALLLARGTRLGVRSGAVPENAGMGPHAVCDEPSRFGSVRKPVRVAVA